MLIALGPVVFIAMTLLPHVDSLVFKTASYSESHADQFFEIHEGELHFYNINNNKNDNNNHNNSNNSKYEFIARKFHSIQGTRKIRPESWL